MEELLLIDEELECVAADYPLHAQAVDDLLRRYCGILHAIVEDGILEGATAERLGTFSMYAHMALVGHLPHLWKEQQAATNQLVQDVCRQDEAERLKGV